MRWHVLVTLPIPWLASMVSGQGAEDLPVAAVSAAPEAELSRLSGVFALTAVSQYFFRGILQENQGLILQPSLELNYSLFEGGTGALTSSTLTLGAWNSVHNG